MATVGRSKTHRIDCIEVLRGFAVLFVMVHHIKGSLVTITAPSAVRFYEYFYGWVGVDLFFAISGFVIARVLLQQLSLSRNSGDFWRTVFSFWIRRAWRLVPSAWLWLAIILLGSAFYNASGVFGSIETNVAATLAGIFNVANFRFANAFGSYFYGTSFVYWSLSLETQFYIVLPICIFVFKRWLPWLLPLAVILQLFSARSLFLMAFRTDAIILGILLAMWSHSKSYHLFEPKALMRIPGAAPGVLIFLLTLLVCMPSKKLNITPFPVGMVALVSIVLVWLASYNRRYILTFPPLRKAMCWVGSRSYAIYLIHIPVFYAVRETIHRAGMDALSATAIIPVALVIVFVLSDLNYRFFELPLRRKGIGMAQKIGCGHHSANMDAGVFQRTSLKTKV